MSVKQEHYKYSCPHLFCQFNLFLQTYSIVLIREADRADIIRAGNKYSFTGMNLCMAILIVNIC